MSTERVALAAELDGKVDKVTGKGLSTNDFTTAEKTKLDGLEPYTIPYGALDATSTATAMTVTVDPPITKLEDGVCIFVKNGVVTSAADFTINVNGLGPKPVYNSMAAATRESTLFNVAYTFMFVYDSTRVEGGCWVLYRGYDSNTNTIAYQVRSNYLAMTAAQKGYRYRIWFTSADGKHWVPANTSSSTNNTAKRTPSTTAIDPFGRIVYNSTNGTVNAGDSLPTATVWSQYIFSLGYSFNDTGAALTLTYPCPVWIKCQPQTNGSALLKGYVQSLPATADGFIYIYLGNAYSATSVEMYTEHPVYYHDGTGIRAWTGATPPAPATAAPAMDGTAAVGTSTLYARSDHVHPSDTSRQAKITASGLLKGNGSGTISAAVAGTDYQAPLVAGTDYQTPLSAYTSNPAMDGSASAGTSTAYSKGDHVHPTDTSRQAKITVSGLLKGNGSGGVSAATAGTDYQAPLSAYTSNPAMDGTASAGTSTAYAKGDHVHPRDTSRQAKITDYGILKGAGEGSVSAAVPGVDYALPESVYYKLEGGGSGSDSSDDFSSADVLYLKDRTVNSYYCASDMSLLTLVMPPHAGPVEGVFARDFILDIDNSHTMTDLGLEIQGLGDNVALRIPSNVELADITMIAAGTTARLYFSEAAPEFGIPVFTMHRLDLSTIMQDGGSSDSDSPSYIGSDEEVPAESF